MFVTIQDLEQEVVQKLENRTTNTNNIDRYVRDALIELTSNPDLRDSFPELETRGPVYNLIGGSINISVQEYAETSFVWPEDRSVKILNFVIWIDFPFNTRTQKLDPGVFQEADEYKQGPSRPVSWYRIGNLIGFDPTPDRNYLVQATYQRAHPINDYFNTAGLLNKTIVLMREEWFEVLEWVAAYRGFGELLNYPRAQEVFNMVWGRPDPGTSGERLPGLITNLKSRRQSERWLKQQPLRPIIKGYTWGNP
jgi:hypothetical protein